MSALTPGWVYQPFTRSVNTGSSPESKELEQRFREIVVHFRRRAERERAFSELARAIDLGKAADWDRYGAQRADEHAPTLACRFLNALPSAIPTPEVGIDSDGEISFSWVASRDRQVHVSLSPKGLLSYAGIFGPTATAHGKEIFDDSIPSAIIEAIRRVGFNI